MKPIASLVFFTASYKVIQLYCSKRAHLIHRQTWAITCMHMPLRVRV
jgi:hypothetical protein